MKTEEEIRITTETTEAEESKEPTINIDPAFTNSAGDNMTFFAWDGPEDPDEEIKEFSAVKSDFETQLNLKFSKSGIIDFITQTIKNESPANDDPAQSKLWENKCDMPGKLKLYLKKGGSTYSQDLPFVRTESIFNQKYKMEKLIKCVSTIKTLSFFYQFLPLDVFR